MLGPLRHKFTAIERAKEQGIGHYFVPRYTRVVDTMETKSDINKAYNLISSSQVRNDMILGDVKASVLYELIETMKAAGISVYTKTEVDERFAVIDHELVWHGGMNLLGKEDVWDNLMRIKNEQVAAELLDIAFGNTTEDDTDSKMLEENL